MSDVIATSFQGHANLMFSNKCQLNILDNAASDSVSRETVSWFQEKELFCFIATWFSSVMVPSRTVFKLLIMLDRQ